MTHIGDREPPAKALALMAEIEQRQQLQKLKIKKAPQKVTDTGRRNYPNSAS
jgi:hypothetical protein